MCQGLTESIWIRRFRFDTLIPSINSQTLWPLLIPHVTNGTIFFICSTSAISALLVALKIPAFYAAPLRWRERCRHKKRNKDVWQIEIHSDELVFSCSDKFLIREKSDCIQKSRDIDSNGETWKQDEKKFEIRRSVEFSSATRRCIPWRVDGHSHGETCRYKRGIRDVDLSESETRSFQEEAVKERPNAGKKAREKPNVSIKSDHPGSPKAERIQLYTVNETPSKDRNLARKNGHTTYTCLQPHFTIRKQSSRSSGESTDENMTTLSMIWTWMWLLVAYFWMPLFEQQFILDKTMRWFKDTWRITFGTVWDSYSAKLENWSVN